LSQLQDPEIFFTKIIKENGSSIEILPSDLKGFHNSPSLMFEEIRVYKDDDKMTIEELPEENGSVIRSNLIYQDGLRNVNSMIFNSQTVDQKLSKTEKTKGYAMESSTFYPHLESVSSTAMVKQEKGDMPNFSSIEETTHEEESLEVASLQVGWWREDNWVLPILILASATLILLLVFQVLLLVRSLRGRGNSKCTRLMSQLLLAGLLACATIAFLYTLAPTHTSCALIRFGSGLSYSIVYSTLLVKLIFLICLNSGIYLTSAYQAILLFFSVLIQLAIGLFQVSKAWLQTLLTSALRKNA